MLYCVSCHAVFSTGTSCPLCHKRNIRQVQDSDLCFFTEQTSVMSSVVEDILKQNGLRFVTRPVYGAAISAVTGTVLESIRFYTLAKYYATACELIDTMFPNTLEENMD